MMIMKEMMIDEVEEINDDDNYEVDDERDDDEEENDDNEYEYEYVVDDDNFTKALSIQFLSNRANTSLSRFNIIIITSCQ